MYKLVRDKTVDRKVADGEHVEWKYVESEEEISFYLRLKLVEEMSELASASTEEEIVEELSDVMDVLESYMKHFKVNPKLLNEHRDEKFAKKGGFTKYILMKA